MNRRALLGVVVLVITPAAVASAQQYRVRVDAQAQAVAFRALTPDSIDAAFVVIASNGGLETPDGYAVRCGAGTYCYYMRPAQMQRAIPTVTSASGALWGMGIEGLSLRATARVVADLRGDRAWPGTDPAVQVVEAYLDYQRSSLVARAGRQLVASRLEPIGFDGVSVTGRQDRARIELTGYAGWGLGQAAALPVTSPALNPIDEWRPRDRQLVAGAAAQWSFDVGDVRAEYRREIDPRDRYFVSERSALSFATRAGAARVSGGLDYNVAEAHLGSADLTVAYTQARYTATAGLRRYRPYFSLWTLWGAFSPVGYDAVHASVQVRASNRVLAHARGERYRYEPAGVSTALVPELERDGWRGGLGATATLNEQWSFDANLSAEHGPGASGRFVDAAVTYAMNDRLTLDAYGGTLSRPLELRYYDAASRWIGARAEWLASPQRRIWADAAYVDDDRERPDAGASSLEQLRLRAGISLAFGSAADRTPLPPARRSPK
jgi:hypothetical protein